MAKEERTEQVNSGASICRLKIYINDLEDDISSKVFKFADKTKIFRKVTNDTDKQSLQHDLENLLKSKVMSNQSFMFFVRNYKVGR